MSGPVGKQLLKSWVIGLALSCAATVLDIISVHTPLQVVSILLTVVQSPVSFLLTDIEKGLGVETTTPVVYATELLSGSIAYGAVAFVVLRVRNRYRPSQSVGPAAP